MVIAVPAAAISITASAYSTVLAKAGLAAAAISIKYVSNKAIPTSNSYSSSNSSVTPPPLLKQSASAPPPKSTSTYTLLVQVVVSNPIGSDDEEKIIDGLFKLKIARTKKEATKDKIRKVLRLVNEQC